MSNSKRQEKNYLIEPRSDRLVCFVSYSDTALPLLRLKSYDSGGWKCHPWSWFCWCCWWCTWFLTHVNMNCFWVWCATQCLRQCSSSVGLDQVNRIKIWQLFYVKRLSPLSNYSGPSKLHSIMAPSKCFIFNLLCRFLHQHGISVIVVPWSIVVVVIVIYCYYCALINISLSFSRICSHLLLGHFGKALSHEISTFPTWKKFHHFW